MASIFTYSCFSTSFMSIKRENYYITTPIYYVNGAPHIGHIYTTMLTDCVAEYQRYRGKDVYFLTGVDEHGLKIQTTAEKNNQTPQAWCDKIADTFKKDFAFFNLTRHNRFIRTTDEDHIKACQHLWTILRDNGYIYKAKYEGWYNVSDECFVTEANIKDGVDKEGKPCKVTIDGEVPLIFTSEENYMFKLSAFGDRLLEFYEKHPNIIFPNFRQEEIVQFIKKGLQDLSISRSKAKIHWGIPVPDDDEHTMYVWIDALTNYLTGSGWPSNPVRWPAIHVIGKDIARFHCVYWPAFLMGAGIELPVYFFIHGWWLAADNRKIGKSLGNASPPDEMARKFGVDALRYFLLSEATGETDATISDGMVAAKLNADLANNLGNLLNRCIAPKILPSQCIPNGLHVDKLRKGDIAGALAMTQLKGKCEELENVIDLANKIFTIVDQEMTGMHTRKSLEIIFQLISSLNAMIQHLAPWKCINTDQILYDLCMYVSLDVMRIIGTLLLPFLTEKAPIIMERLNVHRSLWRIDEDIIRFGVTQPGQVIINNDQSVLFQPYVDKTEKNASAPKKQEENVPDIVKAFAKCDIRICEIKTAEKLAISDKLLKFTINYGEGDAVKSFVSGIADFYRPENLVGRKIAAIVNIKPRKMCDGAVVSEAMLFAAEPDEKTVIIVEPDQSLAPGTKVVPEGFKDYLQSQEIPSDPKKNFDKVLKALGTKDGNMMVGEHKLVANGKAIKTNAPDGSKVC